jgi:hypothetical protein
VSLRSTIVRRVQFILLVEPLSFRTDHTWPRARR